MIEIDNVEKIYKTFRLSTKFINKVRALQGITASFNGGILGFIGPNGAGKTTLIKIITGCIYPTRGNVKVFGYDPWKESLQVKKRVGVLLEDPEFPNISGKKYLTYIGQLRDMDKLKAESHAMDLLESVGINEKDSMRSIKGYSAGMKRRIGIAASLVGYPELVVMDEPTKTLDPYGRKRIIELIRQLHKEKEINFFISSHILSDLEKIVDYVWIINKGKIVLKGSRKELQEIVHTDRYIVEVDKPEILLTLLKEKHMDATLENNIIHASISSSPEEFTRLILSIITQNKLKLIRFEPEENLLEQIISDIKEE